jgi:tetratricopeptide (TPR) repeat protein
VAKAPAARGKSAETSGSWQERDDEEARLQQTLVDLEKGGGAATPAAAWAYYRLSEVYGRQQKIAEQERSLIAALAILERRPVAEARQALGAALDKEIVARRLGDFYWDRRNYGQSYVNFDKAYRYTAEIQMPDAERNRRLARNSAGRMAGACTQKDWAVADEAMAELKERMVSVDAETRRQLEYWVRTGEPRLAARQC